MSLTVEYKDREMQAVGLAAMVAGQLTSAITANGKAVLAVPGGATPELFLSALSKATIAWESLTILLTDERLVPQNSLRSNSRVVKEFLLQGPAAAATFAPLCTGQNPPIAAEKSISELLPIDVCVLGMGTDMHTASLFAGAVGIEAAVNPKNTQSLAFLLPPGSDERRITLTAKALRSSKKTHILIAGADKKQALEHALLPGPVYEAPVRSVLRGSGLVTIHYAD